jgi:hypothetical protein
MTILSELQTKKLGLIDLLSIGYYIFFKNLKSILGIICVTLLPIQVLYLGVNELFKVGAISTTLYFFSSLVFLIAFPIASYVYYTAVAVITEHFVYGTEKHKNVRKLLSSRLMPMLLLSFEYTINYLLRSLLFVIPGIIYSINNLYSGLALIVRDQRGKAAFTYSKAIVKGNWWKVFFFIILNSFITLVSQTILSKFFSLFSFLNPSLISVLSQVLAIVISIGSGIGSILLFLNLEFQKDLKS